jgi:hypothetical protein
MVTIVAAGKTRTYIASIRAIIPRPICTMRNQTGAFVSDIVVLNLGQPYLSIYALRNISNLFSLKLLPIFAD